MVELSLLHLTIMALFAKITNLHEKKHNLENFVYDPMIYKTYNNMILILSTYMYLVKSIRMKRVTQCHF